MKEELYELLLRCRNKDNDAVLDLIEKFKPLVNKYARNSVDDDIENELNLFLIELVRKIPIEKEIFREDKYIIGYIQTSLKHKYIEINKKNYYKNKVDIDKILTLGNECNDIESIFIKNMLENLTLKEKKIIILRFYKRYSDNEIADMFNISRQAVNGTKRRALKKVERHVNN